MQTTAKFDRFKDAEWFDTDRDVIVGGSGGIGSWVCLLLSRIGYYIYLYDFDSVEAHNMGGQLFQHTDVGKQKTEAVIDIVKQFSDHDDIETYGKYTEESMGHSIMMSCFDNMAARKIMFNNWKEYAMLNPDEDCVFIDGRLNAENLQVFCVTRDTIKDYEEHLFDDSEVEDEICTYKQTSHCAAMIASHMIARLTNFIANSKGSNRMLPFYYEYIIPANMTINHV